MSAAAPPPLADSPSSANPARRAWMAVMARSARTDLEAALNRAMEGLPLPAFDWLRPPEIGLAMVRGRVGGTGDAFNLGEATVTRATLRLRDESDEGTTVGVACHLGRDRRRAELAAIADALLQTRQHHARLQAQLIAPLASQLAAKQAQRQQDAASTRVEFFTMVRGD
ncbi:phosphonate C-P lyase system protein PhnG [Paraburkholderia caribensis]|uniref:phosphonate C-P lyase system protein PhnG n=1 Tax=Paraburkholderia caribensis TaxID=75105 RepID=UPI001CADCDDB|nr:phosphonate C-P lyase system protein PhnG [Paraburkholderia caribensis]CAG9245260.1 carbon-phosphorus lyase core complex subunit PhnG [Paraburkholderia caribensis]